MGWLITLVLVTGCDVVYGLGERPDAGVDAADAQSECPDDRDCDQVLDSIDNCIDVINPDQVDGDRDDVGDVCDLCVSNPLSPTKDSDNDQVVDAVDNCPGVYGPDQNDKDHDGVGDPCDDDPDHAGRLRCFVGFDDQVTVNSTWKLEGNWQVAGDLLVRFGTEAPASAELDRSGLFPEVTAFSLATSGHAQDATGRPAEFGIALAPAGVELGLRCVVKAGVEFNDTIAIMGPDDHVIVSDNFPTTTNPLLRVNMIVERKTNSTIIKCRVSTDGDGQLIQLTMPGLPALVGVPAVSIVGRQIGASFQDLTIYEPIYER